MRFRPCAASVYPTSGLPVAQDLASDIVNGRTRISWRSTSSAGRDILCWGVWFGAAGPVDVSGPPDLRVNHQLDRSVAILHAQHVHEVVAVAALGVDGGGGQVVEMVLPWDVVGPARPEGQGV